MKVDDRRALCPMAFVDWRLESGGVDAFVYDLGSCLADLTFCVNNLLFFDCFLSNLLRVNYEC
jgi:hypothetical protein